MAGIRRFVQKQAPEFQQIDIVNQLIIPLNASYQNRMTIQVLPETVCTWEVDRDYLLLALDNLIKNSLEAFERKNIELTQRYLNIKLQITPSHLTIQISDNAGGLDEKLRDHIFEKYISSKGIKKETGLGLSNALNAIEQMGGNLQLAPEQPKNGTTFIIKLTQ